MRVLACGEFSGMSSGYGVYMKELLTRLHNTPGIEIAELASWCGPEHPGLKTTPWKVYPVKPDITNPDAVAEYQSNDMNPYGAGVFDKALIDFKPTHVIDIRDSWHIEHEFRSPLRDFFAYVAMPAVDAFPQHKMWIDMYSTADKLLSYTDWGADVLKNAGLKNVFGTASPCSPKELRELSHDDKVLLKSSLGLGDVTIVGTVMRNQRRKLFPDLFSDFKKYLDLSGRKDVYLLCHTSNPDTWDLDDLLIKDGIGSKVLFTYVCRECKSLDIGFYKGWVSHCDKCGHNKLTFSATQNGANNEDMNAIYNMMDVYVQYAICEGFGMPMAEALSCGVPIMAVDYSAMSEVIQKSNGIPIKVAKKFTEPETFREMALPDSDDFVQKLHNFLSLPKEDREYQATMSKLLYGLRSYDDVANTWLEALRSVKPKLDWNHPKIDYTVPNLVPTNVSDEQFARFLICDVLKSPQYVHTYFEARLVRDLSIKLATKGFSNRYYHEEVKGGVNNLVPFSREIALKHFVTLAEEKNDWDRIRVESLNQ